MDTKSSDVVTVRRLPAVPRTLGLVCAVVAAGALLAGCGSEHADGGQDHVSAVPSREVAASAGAHASPTLTADQARRKALIPAAKVDYAHALRAAVAAVPSSEPLAADLKGTANSPYWQTAVATSDGTVNQVRVDAVTGKAGQPRTESDDTDDKQQLAARLNKATVTAEEAAQTATEKTKGTVSAIELGTADNGSDAVVWSVDVVTTDDWNQTHYEIDATNRKVLRMQVDQD
ncbi:PepSY domain-containing protein [Streptomyces sp. NPDC020742]|uniref:PepSY domain-containing protein n=1 Tax=unclassified Streptomyces TaxID=2593676 RepID=UPI0033F1C1C0